MAFCKHRWTNIKTWATKDTLHVIQRCRWCNRWQRLEMPKGDIKGVKVTYQLKDTDALEQTDGEVTRQHNVDSNNSQPSESTNETLELKTDET